MSGSWQMSNDKKNAKHGHIEFVDHQNLEAKVLTYIDPRRFGHFYILNELNFQKKMLDIPKDITDPDFDENKIAELFFKYPQKTLKPFLLDQKAFPGIGNYMASEICARSGILPTRLTGSITQNEIMKLKESMDLVVSGAIETKGTTFGGGYLDANGSKGEGVKHLVVFYQTYCQMCAEKQTITKVIKTVLGGRGTYHCPKCQI
jgi:formamidopyrimidine-DNA glycosylase